LVYVFWHADARVADIAAGVGITERRTTQVVRDLEAAGLVVAERGGRRKRYTVNGAALGRHPLFAHLSLDQVLLPTLTRLAPETADPPPIAGGSASVDQSEAVDRPATGRAAIEAQLVAIKRRQDELGEEYQRLLQLLQQAGVMPASGAPGEPQDVP
jgi:hypothetical protein